MKKAQLKELSRQLLGTVTDSPDALEYFSTDAGIFEATPTAVVYPANTADVRKTVKFVADQAASGKSVSLVPRGQGTDLGGAAVGEGVQLVMPAHLNKLLRLDRDTATVQPGINYRTLQQTLHTHGRHLPPYPASIDFSTIGGAVANNAAGEKSVKYGVTRDYVKSLKVVLSDGSLVEAHRISARELNRKKGISSFEGEVYRKLDSLILDHTELIAKHQPKTTRNAAGYTLGRVKGKDGSFDLSQIFIGAQGTLGVITEVVLKTLPYNPRTTLVVGYFKSMDALAEAVSKVRQYAPSAVELVDQGVLEYLREHHPGDIEGLVPEKLPKAVLLVEYDDSSQLAQKIKSLRTQRIFQRLAESSRIATDPVEQVALWKVRRSTASTVWSAGGHKRALPFIEDAIVPPDKLAAFLDRTHKLLAKHDLEAAVWGHAADANLQLQPLLDLSRKKDIDRLISLSREFHDTVIALGGSTTGSHGDGLLRALYLKNLYGEEMFELLAEVKHIFDPHRIFNPMKKTEATEEYARAHIRAAYSLAGLHNHSLYM
ncbi:MAG TPA: FAD-binding oxidoreductase [Candidatus Saccharimonadia bacterium]|jgi:FAD/FMN-containing dehydrogenase